MDKKTIIEQSLLQGKTMKEIGKLLGGVSRQRVYQLMTRYNVQTPEVKRQGYWKNQSEEAQWMQRIMCSRGLNKQTRLALLNKFQDNFPSHCPVLGIPLVYGAEGKRQENSASLDKKIPDKGYTVENTFIISWRANRIKNNGVLEDFQKIVRYLS